MRRVFTTIACFLASSLGLFFGLMFVSANNNRFGVALILFTWAISLLILLQAAMAWIRGIRLGRAYSNRAFVVGCIALLSLPLLAALERPSGFDATSPLFSAVSILIVEISSALPLMGLAVHLHIFHGGVRNVDA